MHAVKYYRSRITNFSITSIVDTGD